MDTYNKIMQIFWLSLGIVIFISVTYLCLTEGFERWGSNYLFAGLALFMFLMRRYMMKRMKKHQEFLNKNK